MMTGQFYLELLAVNYINSSFFIMTSKETILDGDLPFQKRCWKCTQLCIIEKYADYGVYHCDCGNLEVKLVDHIPLYLSYVKVT